MLLVFIFAFGKTLHPASVLIFPMLVSFPDGGGTDLHGLRMLNGKHIGLIKQNSPKKALSRRFYKKQMVKPFLTFRRPGAGPNAME